MKIKICCVIAGMIFGFSHPCFGNMRSTNYTITTSAISGGGTPMSSARFQNNGTLGQSSPILTVDSSNFILFPGFWYTLAGSNCVWDIYNDDDGDVDGVDLYQFMNSYEESGLESFVTEFGRTDCSN